MSIQSEITLLQNTKDGLRTAIMEKGVTVYDSDLFSTYPTRISQISMTPGDKDTLFRSILERNVTELEIPEGAKYIAADRFRDITTLTSLTIPSTVTYIDKSAFYNCSSLQSITVNATTPPTLIYSDTVGSEHWPLDSTNNCPIYVPAESVDAYKNAWPAYADRIQAIKKYFVKLTDTSTVPTGTYLIVNETTSNVMESSLIKDTTSYSTGLNTFNNEVGLKQATIVDNAIEATPEMLNYAVFYNVGSDKSTLSWTDPQDGTVYYLGNYQNGWVYGNDRFTQWNITNSNGHFKYGSRYLDIRKTNEISYFGWALAAYTNSIVLYKLEE